MLVAALGGLAVAIGLMPTMRTYALTRRGQMTDRYSKAIALLASDKVTERLGGVYALELLMRESEHEHQTTSAVLAAFVRERTASGSRKPTATPAVDVQAALSVLGRRPLRHEDNPVDLSHSDLRGAVLKNARLAGADLSHCVLRNADLTDANLHGSTLVGADLSEAVLFGTSLVEANLVRCTAVRSRLRLARLAGADLRAADLRQATIQHCHLRAYLATARLAGATLTGSDCRGVSFAGCDVSGTVFDDTDLRGAAFLAAEDLDLTALLRLNGHQASDLEAVLPNLKLQGLDAAAGAPTGLTPEQLADARIDATTQLPEAMRAQAAPRA